MRHQNSNEDLISFIIGGAIVLFLLFYCWTYIVGFLALCGLYYLIQDYYKNNRNH